MGLFLLLHMSKTFSYNREEKLKSRKLMEQLFSAGKSFTIYPVKVFYLPIVEKLDFPVKVGVGTGSRNFKKATERNRIKRILREGYRTEKKILYDYTLSNNKQVAVFLLYLDKTLPAYKTIKAKMPLIFEKLINQLHEVAAANT